MSILIKGMEMPQTCGECSFRDYDYCVLTDKLVEPDDEPLKDCPIIPVPPNVRLIDADATHLPIERVKRWEISSDGYYPYCSGCHYRPDWGQELTKYCPNCGALMTGDKEGGR